LIVGDIEEVFWWDFWLVILIFSFDGKLALISFFSLTLDLSQFCVSLGEFLHESSTEGLPHHLVTHITHSPSILTSSLKVKHALEIIHT